MDKAINDAILLQKSQVFDRDFKVTLDSACTIGDGIIQVEGDAKLKALKAFDELPFNPTFFIPASGSGSRMFKFLYQWVEDGEDTDMVSAFFNQLDLFPFASKVKARNHRARIANEILGENNLNYGGTPKGLIPFHLEGEQIYSAFQEHVRQAKSFLKDDVKIHFTIQKDFESRIIENIEEVNDGVTCTFSEQSKSSDAYCFDNDENVVMAGLSHLRRPAGHGAILTNLNDIDSDLILIKNIDNIQHNSKSEQTEEVWKLSIGTLLNFKKALKELNSNYSTDKLIEINKEFQFLSADELSKFNADDLENVINRPTRVCGMVKNEGAPGGGPFWMQTENGVSKQIVEGIQISNQPDQKEIVQNSSHFNPVFLVVCKTDVNDKRLDLMDFRDDSAYFVVEKTEKEKSIKYRELPGLWNGSMSNWNTVFMEIPSSVFSPVKTVLDLNTPAHKA